jgi:hypothetical protein
MTRVACSTALARLVGRWETEGRDSSAVFEVAVVSGRPVVTGFDDSDGECFKISGVAWDGKSLGFASMMPSTRFRSRHKLTIVRAGLIDHELTVIERWIKVGP